MGTLPKSLLCPCPSSVFLVCSQAFRILPTFSFWVCYCKLNKDIFLHILPLVFVSLFVFFLFLIARVCSISLWEVRLLTCKWRGVGRCVLSPATCQGTYFAKFHFNTTYFGIMHLRFLWNFLNYSFIAMLKGENHH